MNCSKISYITDPTGELYTALGFSPGFLPEANVSAYAKLLPMLAGIGSPGTLQVLPGGWGLGWRVAGRVGGCAVAGRAGCLHTSNSDAHAPHPLLRLPSSPPFAPAAGGAARLLWGPQLQARVLGGLQPLRRARQR